jgi:hypothetical protein
VEAFLSRRSEIVGDHVLLLLVLLTDHACVLLDVTVDLVANLVREAEERRLGDGEGREMLHGEDCTMGSFCEGLGSLEVVC